MTTSKTPVKMILQPSNVELTKIHYYEKNLAGEKIPTISQEVEEKWPQQSQNVFIKKNIFGHKWVLRVNEDEDDVKKSKIKLLLYVLVFLSITVAVAFGIFFSLTNTLFKRNEQYVKTMIYPDDAGIRNRPVPEAANTTTVPTEEYTETNPPVEVKPYCNDCLPNEVCMKANVTSKPECTPAQEVDDPTGCGGLCLINVEVCEPVSKKYNVYQCFPKKNLLKCGNDEFNCEEVCINNIFRCDGTIHCANRMDENNCECDLFVNFQCGENTSCLELNKRCDQIVDCWDGSDEENCYYVNNCTFDEFRCNDGQCILRNEFCDGEVDCKDESDEPYGCSVIE